MEARTAYDSKPDPEEPWRYVCPTCEHQVFRDMKSRKYHCNRCRKSMEKSELKDQKEIVR